MFSARHLLNIFSRHRPPPDEPIPQERSKRGFFSRRIRSNSSLELATTKPKPVPEGEVEECEGEQGQYIDDVSAVSTVALLSQRDNHQRSSTYNSLSARKDKGKQRDDPPAGTQSPLSYDRIPTAHFDSKDHRTLWERLLQSRGKNYTFGSLYPVIRLANTPQRSTPCNTRHSNYSLFTVGSPRHPVDVAACRDEDVSNLSSLPFHVIEITLQRYGIVPESDAEAAAAMLRTNDNVADSSTQLSQLAIGAHPSQGQHTQTQASTSGPQEIEVSCCCGFSFICHRSNQS